ncbi:hypothetical protein [Gordonia zhaorongruii]|uniref:hypothetical protein n=1 Tax=Gordonia zhaorongruii TaxID=2597659 RepID=UPI0014049541|nr:hypothetical protein [Gordonia zhaorongruii]
MLAFVAWMGFVGVRMVQSIVRAADACPTALDYAAGYGLRLSDRDAVVSCEWQDVPRDPSATIMVRASSPAARTALIRRSGAHERVTTSDVRVNGAWTTRTHRPNLERSRQVFYAEDDYLRISYDPKIEGGLLLQVHVLQT